MKVGIHLIGTAVAVPLLTLGMSAGAAPNADHTSGTMGEHHISADHMASADHMPAVQTQGAISYVSGGVGDGEAAAMKQAAKDYPLAMEFLERAKPRDEYLADINVRIQDEHNQTVLDTTANGPFMLAKLPAGKYTITAKMGDKAEKRTVQIGANAHHRVVFEWGQA